MLWTKWFSLDWEGFGLKLEWLIGHEFEDWLKKGEHLR